MPLEPSLVTDTVLLLPASLISAPCLEHLSTSTRPPSPGSSLPHSRCPFQGCPAHRAPRLQNHCVDGTKELFEVAGLSPTPLQSLGKPSVFRALSVDRGKGKVGYLRTVIGPNVFIPKAFRFPPPNSARYSISAALNSEHPPVHSSIIQANSLRPLSCLRNTLHLNSPESAPQTLSLGEPVLHWSGESTVLEYIYNTLPHVFATFLQYALP